MTHKATDVFADTNEVIEREMTADELDQHEADLAVEAEKIAEKESKAAARVELLAKLGITEDEAKLLLA